MQAAIIIFSLALAASVVNACPISEDFRSGGYHCNNRGCLNNNIGYSDLATAWALCGEVPECKRIMKYSDGRFFLRRADDIYDDDSNLEHVGYTCQAVGDQNCFDVEITTTQYGRENSWSFGSCSSAQAYTNDNVYTEQCCLSPGDYTLSCKDSYGDGWHGGFIEIGGERYCEDFTYGTAKNTVVAITAVTTTTPVPTITDSKGRCQCTDEYYITLENGFVEAHCGDWDSDKAWCYLSGGAQGASCPGARKSGKGNIYWTQDLETCQRPGQVTTYKDHKECKRFGRIKCAKGLWQCGWLFPGPRLTGFCRIEGRI